MMYAIYFTWDDGDEDSCNTFSAADRNQTINHLLRKPDITDLSFCKIYRNGEYGEIIKVREKGEHVYDR